MCSLFCRRRSASDVADDVTAETFLVVWLRRLRPAWSWTAHTTAITSAGVFGVDWSGALLTERNGYIVPLGQLFSPAVAVLAPL